jgi:hypothetical protein
MARILPNVMSGRTDTSYRTPGRWSDNMKLIERCVTFVLWCLAYLLLLVCLILVMFVIAKAIVQPPNLHVLNQTIPRA